MTIHISNFYYTDKGVGVLPTSPCLSYRYIFLILSPDLHPITSNIFQIYLYLSFCYGFKPRPTPSQACFIYALGVDGDSTL